MYEVGQTVSFTPTAYKEGCGANTRRDEWISVDDKLPEDGQDVLCYYEYYRYGNYNRIYRTIDRGYFISGRFGGEPANGRKAKVLFWMPLPKAPEGYKYGA